jgi:hypothetical protein
MTWSQTQEDEDEDDPKETRKSKWRGYEAEELNI